MAYSGPPTDIVLNIVQISMAGLLRRLGNIMSDDEHVRWTEAEAIDWFNDAAQEIVIRRPGARAVTALITLTAGTYQQTPQGVAQLLDVVRNIQISGASGGVIRITDRQALDDADPDWHSTAAGTTKHYMIDERSPTTFYVYPPAVDGAKVEALMSVSPPVVTDPAGSIDLRSEFINAILNWAMYRCHTKDSEYSNGAVASLHYQAFTDAIGAPAQAAQSNSASGNSP